MRFVPSIFIILLVTIGIELPAQTTARTLSTAAELYHSKRYTEAIAQYEQLLPKEPHHADLYYNIGNCYLEQKKIGKAILHYERALYWQPSHADARHNLSLARQQIIDPVGNTKTFFVLRWWAALRGLLSSSVWAWLALTCWWMGAAGFLFWLLSPVRQHRQRGLVAGLAMGLLSLIPWGLGKGRYWEEELRREAVLLPAQADFKYAPDSSSTTIMSLHEGNKVQVLDSINQWLNVQLENGEQGWLPSSVLERVK